MANEHRKMTVARALKEKERILRRLAEAKTLFEGVNCVKVGEVRDADPEAVYGDVQALQKRYLEIKKAIAVANAGISPKLAELLVAKTELNFYHRLSCRVLREIWHFRPVGRKQPQSSQRHHHNTGQQESTR